MPQPTDILYLTEGTDTIAYAADDLTDSVVNTTAAAMGSADSVAAGGGYDVLSLYGGGLFDLNVPQTLSGFEEVRLTYVNGSGPSEVRLREAADISLTVSGTGYGTTIRLSSGTATLDLDGITAGNYYFGSGSAVVDGSDSGSSWDHSNYYLSTGEVIISDANAQYNNYHLAGGQATIYAGGTYDIWDGGRNAYYLSEGTYALHGASGNIDTFYLNGRISQHPRRTTPLQIDTEMYKWRHLIENFFCKLKEFKRIALRADKTGQSFQAMIHLTAAVINSR
jgi:hypothetical protein